MVSGVIDYKNITFSHEKLFLLDDLDGYHHYWHKSGNLKKHFGYKVFSKGIMVWGGIGYNDSTKIYMTKQTIDSVYQSIMKRIY